jgi:hypothetical protein
MVGLWYVLTNSPVAEAATAIAAILASIAAVLSARHGNRDLADIRERLARLESRP